MDDNEDAAGMEEALERAREMPKTSENWEETMARLNQWDEEPSATQPPPAEQEQPSELTGDAQPRLTGDKDVPSEPWALIQHELEQNRTRVPAPDPLEAKMDEAGWHMPKPEEGPASWEHLAEQLPPEAEHAPEAEASSPPPEPPPDIETLLAQTAPPPAPKPPEPEAPKPTNWTSLLEELQAAQHGSDTTKTVGAMLHAAAPGFQAPSGAGEGDIAAAKSAIDIERTKADDADRQRKANASLLEETRLADRRDPKSGIAQRKREAYLEQFGKGPKSLDQMSAEEIDELTKTQLPLAGHASTEKVAQAKLDETRAEKDKTAAAKKDASDKAQASDEKSASDEVEAILVDPRAKKLGLTREMLDGLNRKGLDAVHRQMQSLPKEKPSGGGKNAGVKIEPGKIDTVPERRPGYRELVKGIAEHRLKAPEPGTRFGAELISDVLAYKPDLDATEFGAYKKVAEQQATGKDVVAIDVAREHLATARSLIPKNASLTWVNKVKQAVASGTGDAEFKPFIAASTVAAHELAKVYNIEDQAGKAMVEHQMSSVQSPDQLDKVFGTFEELIVGKQHGLERQRARVAPGGGGETPHEKKTPLETRSVKGGGTAYKGRKSGKWFVSAKLAEEN